MKMHIGINACFLLQKIDIGFEKEEIEGRLCIVSFSSLKKKKTYLQNPQQQWNKLKVKIRICKSGTNKSNFNFFPNEIKPGLSPIQCPLKLYLLLS